MKNIIKGLFIVALMMMTTLAVNAQNKGDKRISREKLAEVQAQNIARQLAFDDKTTARFIETYCKCQREVWEKVPRMKHGSNGQGSQMSEADSEAAIKQRMERSQKLLDIRKKYYEEYSKFLTQSQIQRVYEIEKQMMNKLAKHGQGKSKRRR